MCSDIVDRFKAATAKVGAARLTGTQTARSRLIFAMDATASREPTWDRASGWCHQMFDAVGKIGTLDVRLVYFRGAYPPIAGPFKSDARYLADTAGRVRCLSGHTQIGRTLDHIGRMHARSPVAAVIYIGDACEEAGDVLVTKAAKLGVRIFLFHEDPQTNRSAIETLKSIAGVSGGVYLPFDQESAHRLGELLAGVAAWATGGRKALEARGDAASRLLLGKLN